MIRARWQRPIGGAAAAALVAASVALAAQRPDDHAADADRVFAKWTASTPGCAVGVSEGGAPVLERAYGMADLEHGVKNTPETIFEAGSVSKQFTAAAVLLLAHDGTISLDEPARKYLPELPDYGQPLTIRHMLTHTSGLRDWGSVEAIAGWPRTTRVYTQAHVLDIVSRQRALNFTPGTHWSYSNTGYNLAAMIVARVSGMPFPEFTRQRIFEPLGMTRTSWRDDHTRIVKDRAIAYDEGDAGFHTEMPFEDIYGNAGLLTTVGDLLKWNENFVSPVVGGAAFVAEEQQPGHFNDGRMHDYALGLTVGTYKGLREVRHSGSTAGYRAYLTRFPDQHVSVAVLCNVSTAEAADYAHRVSDLFLSTRLKPDPPAPVHPLTAAEGDALEGMYRNTRTGTTIRLTRAAGGLRLDGRVALTARSPRQLVAPSGRTFDFDGHGSARVAVDAFGTADTYERVIPATPTPAQLQQLAGTYSSADAEVTMTAEVAGGSLVLKRRPDTTIALTPTCTDTFTSRLGSIIFHRDKAGQAASFSVVQDRVWDLKFVKIPADSRPSSR